MSCTRLLIRVTVVIFLVGPASYAQVRQVQDGRALDANPQVGSGGLNFARPQPLLPDANLYVTGNVTRGASFRGYQAVRDFSSISITLPSDTLARFRRDTVGIEDVIGGPDLFLPQPYFSPRSTITDFGAIEAGLNLPGSSIPRSPNIVPRQDLQRVQLSPLDTPLDSRLIPFDPLQSTPLMPEQGALMPRPENPRLSSSSLFNFGQPAPPPGASASPSLWDAAAQGVGPVPPLLQRDLQLPTPAMGPELEYRDPLDRRLQLTPDALLAPTMLQPLDQMVPAKAQPVETSLGRTVPGDLLDKRLSLPPIDRLAWEAYTSSTGTREEHLPGLAELVYGQRQAPAEGETPLSLAEIEPQDWARRLEYATGQDVYQDLFGAYQYLREQEPQMLAQPPPETVEPPGGTSPLQPSAERIQALTDEVARAMAQDANMQRLAEREERQRQATAVAQELLLRPLETFAGRSKDEINRLLADAEALLKEQEYYRAVARYELACAAAPRNPLPMIGRGHALIAAGEYLSAVFWLTRGIERFEGVASFNLDLPRLIGNPDLLDRRRADLENVLDAREDYRLRFLLGYIEYYSRLHEIGLANLRRAADEAPTDSLIARFPNLLKPSNNVAYP